MRNRSIFRETRLLPAALDPSSRFLCFPSSILDPPPQQLTAWNAVPDRLDNLLVHRLVSPALAVVADGPRSVGKGERFGNAGG